MGRKTEPKSNWECYVETVSFKKQHKTQTKQQKMKINLLNKHPRQGQLLPTPVGIACQSRTARSPHAHTYISALVAGISEMKKRVFFILKNILGHFIQRNPLILTMPDNKPFYD